MAVEINILSGNRRGQRLVFDGMRIRVGPHPAGDVYFDPLSDSSARDRSVVLNRLDDGWYIQSVGEGQTFVNQSPIIGLTRLKSGAVVRMSEFGPEFEFRIIAESASATADNRSKRLPGRESTAATLLPPIGPCEPACAAATLPQIAKQRSSIGDRRRTAALVGLGILGLLLLLVLIPLISRPSLMTAPGSLPPVAASPAAADPPLLSAQEPHTADRPFSSASSTPPPPPSTPVPSTPVPSTPVPSTPVPSTPVPSTPVPSTPVPSTPVPSTPVPSTAAAPVRVETPPTDTPRSEFAARVLLIQVEKAGQFWPFAVCSAIAEKTALTSAREAIQLGVWLNDPKSGFKAWVTNPTTGWKFPVVSTRIYAVRVLSPAQQKPNDWLYTNLGLLTVEGTLPNIIEMAGASDLAELGPGKTLRVCCYAHEGDLVTPEDRFELQTAPGKILFINAHPELPGRPRVLGIKAELPKFPHGSALVNSQGKLVAVHAAAVSEIESELRGAAGTENMHYATVIQPSAIDLWLNHSDSSVWVSTAELGLPNSGQKAGSRGPR